MSMQIVGKLMKGERPLIPAREALPGPDNAQFSGLHAYIALMERCWAQDPAVRPNFKEIITELR
jgi:hypothetical protein